MSAIPARPPRTTRLARNLGLDGNPLRRATDRAMTWIRTGLLAAFLVGGPLSAIGAGHWMYAGMTEARAQIADRHSARAVRQFCASPGCHLLRVLAFCSGRCPGLPDAVGPRSGMRGVAGRRIVSVIEASSASLPASSSHLRTHLDVVAIVQAGSAAGPDDLVLQQATPYPPASRRRAASWPARVARLFISSLTCRSAEIPRAVTTNVHRF